MKRIFASLLIAASMTATMVPMSIIQRYTEHVCLLQSLDGECLKESEDFVLQFGVVKETTANREAADAAQQKFARTFRNY
jgi:hypothetical protein